MGNEALKGSLEKNYVKLGATRWVAGPYDTYIDETTKMDLSNLPSPLLDLGACRQDTQISMTAEVFKHMTGVPKTLKQKIKTALDMTVQFTLEEYSGANMCRALYNTNYAFKKFSASPAVVQAAAIPVGNIVQMTDSTGYVENSYIALATSSGGLPNSTDEAKIVEISGNYLILDRDVATYAAAPYVGVILSYKAPWGTAKACKMSLFGVFDDIDEGQMLIAIPRAVITSGLNAGIPATENAKIPLEVTAESFYDIDMAAYSLANVLKFQ